MPHDLSMGTCLITISKLIMKSVSANPKELAAYGNSRGESAGQDVAALASQDTEVARTLPL